MTTNEITIHSNFTTLSDSDLLCGITNWVNDKEVFFKPGVGTHSFRRKGTNGGLTYSDGADKTPKKNAAIVTIS